MGAATSWKALPNMPTKRSVRTWSQGDNQVQVWAESGPVGADSSHILPLDTCAAQPIGQRFAGPLEFLKLVRERSTVPLPVKRQSQRVDLQPGALAGNDSG
ncbi:hypothetical protein D3C85_1198160 [compost metagenome]